MNVTNFQEACDLWEASKSGFIKESSMAAYSLTITKHLAPHFTRLDEITPESFQALIDSKAEAGLSLCTIKGIILVMKMIIHYCEDEGWMENRSYRLKLPHGRKRADLQVIPPAKVKRLMNWLQSNPSPFNVGIMICIYCGLRIGEVCALQWDDVDLDEKTIHVRKTVYRLYVADRKPKKTTIEVGAPKTDDSWRDVPIADKLAKAIVKGCEKGDGNTFLLSGKDTPIDPQNFRNHYKRVCESLGIQQQKVHSLRHTFATKCIESRCDFKTLSSILGHSDVTTTLNIYVHPDMTQKRRVVEKMVKAI